MTIAFITSMLSNNLSRLLMLSIKDSLEQLGINLVTITGTSINQQVMKWVDESTNSIYDIVSSSRFDGAIIYGGAIGQLVTDDVMREFCNKFDIPIVNISSKIEGIPSVIVSNYTGMYSAVDHIIKEHGAKNIGFIKGPQGHIEAEERYSGYVDALKDNGLEVDKRNIFMGNFSPQAGINAVREYLDNRDKVLDCLVCVDDDTSYGVIDELHRRDIRIPDDISVIGFDDAEASANINPPLTTVMQPFNKLGKVAVDTLMDLINGKSVDELIKVDSELVIRDSCGCFRSLRSYFPKSDIKLDEKHIKEVSEEELVEAIITSFKKLNNLTYSRVYNFLENFFQAISTGEDGGVYRAFNKIVEVIDHSKINLLNEFLDYCSSVIEVRNGMETQSQLLLEKIKLRSSVNIIQDRTIEKINSRDKYFHLNNINQGLHGALSLEGLLDGIYKTLPNIGINSFYIVSSSRKDIISEKVKLIYGYNRSGIIDTSKYSNEFSREIILPDKLLNIDGANWLVMTLSFNDEIYGYLVIDSTVEASELTHAISWHFSSSLKRISILEEKNRKAQELEEALATLKETQAQLIESEKLSSLGAMVAGVAHEINTPLGIVVTSVSYIDDLTRELLNVYHKNELSKGKIEYYFKSIEEIIDTTMSSAKRAAALVKSFKKVAVDQASEEKRLFNVKEYIYDTLISLKHNYKKRDITIEVNCDSNLEISSYPGTISQIVTNLITNTLIHGFPNEGGGLIQFQISKEDNQLKFIYKDNGVGIHEESISKIFEPFYTTKRSKGGSGLGLHIVHNLVTQVLGGSIVVNSVEGLGVEFVIDFHLT